MFRGVGQRFLHDPVDRGLDRRRQPFSVKVGLDRHLQPVGTTPVRQGFKRGLEAQLIELRRPKLDDQLAQPVDLGAGVPSCFAHDRVALFGGRLSHGGRQHHLQRAEPLEGLVVQFARPASAFLLGAFDRVRKALLGH